MHICYYIAVILTSLSLRKEHNLCKLNQACNFVLWNQLLPDSFVQGMAKHGGSGRVGSGDGALRGGRGGAAGCSGVQRGAAGGGTAR